MKITILCSDANHPINTHLIQWRDANRHNHEINICRTKADLTRGDILFLISCTQIITKSDRERYSVALVIHASDLPRGRGWSPHIWQILEGSKEVTCSLLEAEDKVDSGRIWKKVYFDVPPTALWDEINARLFAAELTLMDFAVMNFHTIQPKPQPIDIVPSYYPRRTPDDSMLNVDMSIRSQFDRIRVCDPDRFPAFFDHLGCRYILKLEKADD